MRKLIAKYPWILVVAFLAFVMLVSIAVVVIAILNQPTIIPH